MVFCFQNYFDQLLGGKKKYSCDQEKPLKFKDESQEFTKIWRSLKQFIRTVKGQYNF